jgi:hypothetical protein
MTKDNSPPRRDYEVGYGKPPKQHQFKKGQSGNPNGPKPKRQVEQVNVGATLSQPVMVKTNQGKKLLHPLEAMLENLVRRALEDDHLGSLIEVLNIFERYGEFAAPVEVTGGGVVVAPPGRNPHEWLDEVAVFVPYEE